MTPKNPRIKHGGTDSRRLEFLIDREAVVLSWKGKFRVETYGGVWGLLTGRREYRCPYRAIDAAIKASRRGKR